jgi:hypothetical protein
MTAVVILPKSLLPAAPPAVPEIPVGSESAAGLSLPGAAAEANSHVLPARSATAGGGDPLIAAAEETIRAAGSAATARVPAARTPEGEPRKRRAGGPAGTGGPSRGAAESGAYVIGPDAHERSPEPALPQDGGLDQDTFTMRLPRTPKAARTLPKRVPKAVRTTAAPAGRKRGVDAEELRRRLGGFHQGAKDGRRDVEAELREETGALDPLATDGRLTAQQHTEAAGDTVEEAHS